MALGPEPRPRPGLTGTFPKAGTRGRRAGTSPGVGGKAAHGGELPATHEHVIYTTCVLLLWENVGAPWPQLTPDHGPVTG